MTGSDLRNPTDAKRVFIVGCRRSGTTWIAMLLAQHPNVVALQQSGFFLSLDHVTEWLVSQRKYGRAVLTSNAESEGADGLQRQSIDSLFSVERYYDLVRPLAEDVYDNLARGTENTKAVVDHTPEHVRIWEHVHAILPEAHFLHVVRDPRSVFSSYVAAGKSWSSKDTFTNDPIEFGEEWVREVQRGREIRDATDCFTEIRYEAMKRNGPEELERVYRSLGLECDREMCERAIEACSMDKLRKSARGPANFFRKGEAEGWRNELSAKQIETIEYLCADTMDAMDYERVNATFAGPPSLIVKNERKKRMVEKSRQWVRESDGPAKRVLRWTANKFPRLRKIAWRVLR